MPPKSFTIREITGKKQWASIYPLVKQTNPTMTKTIFEKRLKEMLAAGYRCVGTYRDNTLIGVAGFWTGTRFWCGKYIDIDNVVVDEKYRSQGAGEAMMRWIEKEGKRQKCEITVLDSYTTFHGAHKFYFRQGYVILGYHFTKKF